MMVIANPAPRAAAGGKNPRGSPAKNLNLSDDLYELMTRLADRRNSAEWNLIESITPKPVLVKVASAAGVEPGDFWEMPLRTICVACTILADKPTVEVLRLVRDQFKRDGCWDPTTPAYFRGGLFSNETLAWLAERPTSPCQVEMAARKLISLSCRQCEADQHLDAAMGLLEFRTSPAGAAKSLTRKPIFTLAPRGMRGAA